MNKILSYKKMLNKIFNYFALILLLSTVSASINVCPEGLDSYYYFSLPQFKISIQENSIFYKLENKIKINHCYMSLEILSKEVFYISLILSKHIYKSNIKKNALSLDFIYEDESKGILLEIKKCLNDACSGNKDEIITIDSTIQESQKGPNAIKETNKEVSNVMKFDIYLEKTEIKIMLSEKVIYSKKFDVENLLGDTINVYI